MGCIWTENNPPEAANAAHTLTHGCGLLFPPGPFRPFNKERF